MTEIVSREAVVKLIEELKEASRVYYLGVGETILTDEEFDAKQTYLETLRDGGNFVELFASGSDGEKVLDGEPLLGAVDDSDEVKVSHDYPMLSLSKAKKAAQLSSYLSKVREAGAEDFILQAKLDGVAISVKYVDGVLTQIATRGDGTVGDNVTYMETADSLTIVGMPSTISTSGNVEVRGEIFFTNEQFVKVNAARIAATGQAFENPRNSVSGLVKKAKSGLLFPVEMTFGAYSLVEDGHMSTINKFDEDPNFETIGNITEKQAKGIALTGFKNDDEIHDSIAKIGNIIDGFTVPVDGIVIKPANEGEMYEKMGLTSHHPVSQIAWKYPSEQGESVVTAITLTVGKAGKVTPIADIEPVRVDGSTISRASLHNFNLVATKDIRVGSKVIVEKANMIIPQIVAVIENPDWTVKVEVPVFCPSCNELLEKQGDVEPPRTLLCVNNNCQSRDFFALKSAVGRTYLDIDGLSEATLTYLNDIGRVKNVSDIYELTLEELSEAELAENTSGTKIKLGEKRATNILNHIEKSKTLPLERILPSLSIPTIGRRASKTLVKTFGTIDELLKASVNDFENIDGFGKIKAENVFNGLHDRQHVIEKMRKLGVTFGENDSEDVAVDSDSTDVDLSGISFAISGTVPQPFENRNAMVDFIEANGGEFHSAPKATTTYMIGEASGTSSKIKKAASLGVSFLNAEEFTEKFVK